MFSLDVKTNMLIEKACKGKKHIKLTVGICVSGEKTIHVFDETGEIPNKDYIYEIGSITKTFTGALLAKHIYEGKMSLDDPVSKYINGLNNDTYYPTLKRLATHTAGYPNHLPMSRWDGFKYMLNLIFRGKNQGVFPFQMDLDKMKHLLQKNKLQDKDYPWQYSNFGIALLGYAIGVVSGRGYWDTMNDFMSNELGLKQSYTGTNPDKNLRGFNSKNKDIGNWIWGKDFTAPAGDISATAADLLEYARINLYEERPYLSLCHQRHTDSKKYDMGLGWVLMKNKNYTLFHSGGTGAFRTFLVIDKEKKCASVVLSNYPILKGIDEIGFAVLENLQKS